MSDSALISAITLDQRTFLYIFKFAGSIWVKEEFVLFEAHSYANEMKSVAEAQQQLADHENLAQKLSTEGVELEQERNCLKSKLHQLREENTAKLQLHEDLERCCSSFAVFSSRIW